MAVLRQWQATEKEKPVAGVEEGRVVAERREGVERNAKEPDEEGKSREGGKTQQIEERDP